MSSKYIEACIRFMEYETLRENGLLLIRVSGCGFVEYDPITDANQRDEIVEKMRLVVDVYRKDWIVNPEDDVSSLMLHEDRATAILMCIGEVIGVTYER